MKQVLKSQVIGFPTVVSEFDNDAGYITINVDNLTNYYNKSEIDGQLDPKNYLSKESSENMLNAMVTAGVIASYTMTWDDANSRYAFNIVAPAQSN